VVIVAEPSTLRPVSLETGFAEASEIEQLAAHLPRGTAVYIPHLPRYGLHRTYALSVALRRAGFEPVPHIAARRLVSSGELRTFVQRCVGEALVRRALILGGDQDPPAGPYADAEAILVDEALDDWSIDGVAFAAYPEPHPRLTRSQLTVALRNKVAWAARRRLDVHLITQFCFDPAAIARCADELSRLHPSAKLLIGIPGPVSWAGLMKFARLCGVATALNRGARLGADAARLATTDPTELQASIATKIRSVGADTVVGTHVFAFGGLLPAARWMATHHVRRAPIERSAAVP
jgi:methylenetetrahydrofolate reductase (NADPH)